MTIVIEGGVVPPIFPAGGYNNPLDYGTLTGTSANLAITAALQAGSTLLMDGTYQISAPIIIPGSTELLMTAGVTIEAAPGYMGNLIQSESFGILNGLDQFLQISGKGQVQGPCVAYNPANFVVSYAVVNAAHNTVNNGVISPTDTDIAVYSVGAFPTGASTTAGGGYTTGGALAVVTGQACAIPLNKVAGLPAAGTATVGGVAQKYYAISGNTLLCYAAAAGFGGTVPGGAVVTVPCYFWLADSLTQYTGITNNGGVGTDVFTGCTLVGGGGLPGYANHAQVMPFAGSGHGYAIQGTKTSLEGQPLGVVGSGMYLQGDHNSGSPNPFAHDIYPTRVSETGNNQGPGRWGIEGGANATDARIHDFSNMAGQYLPGFGGLLWSNGDVEIETIHDVSNSPGMGLACSIRLAGAGGGSTVGTLKLDTKIGPSIIVDCTGTLCSNNKVNDLKVRGVGFTNSGQTYPPNTGPLVNVIGYATGKSLGGLIDNVSSIQPWDYLLANGPYSNALGVQNLATAPVAGCLSLLAFPQFDQYGDIPGITPGTAQFAVTIGGSTYSYTGLSAFLAVSTSATQANALPAGGGAGSFTISGSWIPPTVALAAGSVVTVNGQYEVVLSGPIVGNTVSFSSWTWVSGQGAGTAAQTISGSTYVWSVQLSGCVLNTGAGGAIADNTLVTQPARAGAQLGSTVRPGFQLNPAASTVTYGLAYLQAGDIVTYGPSGVAYTQANTGVFGTPVFSTKCYNIAAPAGTASTVGVMAGLGATATFTPVTSGKVLVRIDGQCGTATAAAVATLTGKYGTGAAPANGAAVSGTTFGQAVTARGTVAGSAGLASFSIVAEITGLTLNTALWFDFSQLTSVAADATLPGTIVVTVQEVP